MTDGPGRSGVADPIPPHAAVSSPVPAEQAAALFEQVHEAFLRARAKAGSFEHHYRIAGHQLTLSFAGQSLIPALTPAFEHLRLDEPLEGADGLTICAWDGTSTGIAPPAPEWGDARWFGNTEMRAFSNERFQTAFDSYLGMLSMYDDERRLAIFWLRDGRRVPITLAGTPFRILIQWWAAARHEGQLIHAAAVGSDSGGVLIAGPSGAGKTTTALIGLENGLRYAGDDFVLVQRSAEPRAFSLYSSAKLDHATLNRRFPGLRNAMADRPRAPEEKGVLFVHRRWPARTTSELRLHALLLPTVADREDSCLLPVGPAEALRTLLPGIFPFPGQRQSAVARLGTLARALPAYRLELGRASHGVARVLDSFVHEATRS